MSLLLLFRPSAGAAPAVVVTGHFDSPTPDGSHFDHPTPSAAHLDPPTPSAGHFDPPTPS